MLAKKELSTIDYILFILFIVIGWCLLIGMTKVEKKWIGGTGAVFAVIFIVVSQIIKLQSGFFSARTTEASTSVGQWVVPCFLILGFYVLGIINYRLVKLALTKQSWQRWGWIGFVILFSILYIWVGGFALFIVAFTYFPFAP
ncbi:hypothetical protein [Aquibacillus sediminis]|uniref:hypothetical protein n=1 Tax=Aquibacillus sediminis TaxID=2574734 RepID=UPI001107AF33|nr:hypothetical protein [Aquibacillus sediminis]